MIWRKLSRILAICGTLMVAFGLGTLPAQGAETARSSSAPLLAPSPRPPLPPTARPDHDSKSGTAMGRITGTIIDLDTGAPTPGVKVNIGGMVVSSDANGNYDLWVAAGPYAVALVLEPAQGQPAQGQQMVNVGTGTTTILHLNFRGPPAPSATPAAADNGQAAVPAPTVVAVPPTTAAAQPARAAGGAPRPHATPRLPRTAEDASDSLRWVALGALLLLGGVALELGRKRLQFAGVAARAARFAPGYENARLLAALLARSMDDRKPARGAENDLLLAALLTADQRERPSDEQRSL